MEARTVLPGLGRAVTCEAARSHRPPPLRFVWHHVLPEACGGPTSRGNCVQACDNCHMAAHVLLWYLANGGIPPGTLRPRGPMTWARRGYAAAVAVGTAGKIPRQ
jgi:HNH endonuclease